MHKPTTLSGGILYAENDDEAAGGPQGLIFAFVFVCLCVCVLAHVASKGLFCSIFGVRCMDSRGLLFGVAKFAG